MRDLAPTLGLKTAMAQLVSAEFKASSDLTNHMRGEESTRSRPWRLRRPSPPSHERTRPSDWLRPWLQIYVGEGVAK